MIEIIKYILIGAGLSIDAFLVCLSIGCDPTRNKRAIMKTPLLIGFFHILFPILAYLATHVIINLPASHKIAAFGSYVAGGIFFLLGIMNILHSPKEEKCYLLSMIDIILLSFSVSIDSILIGISLGFSGTFNIYIAGVIFGIISGITSLIAIKLGCISQRRFRHANILSGIFFIILGILTFTGIM